MRGERNARPHDSPPLVGAGLGAGSMPVVCFGMMPSFFIFIHPTPDPLPASGEGRRCSRPFCSAAELDGLIPYLKPERLTRPQAGGGVRSTEPLFLTTQQINNPEVGDRNYLYALSPLRGLACVATISRGFATLHHLPVVHHPFGVQQLQTPNSKLKPGGAAHGHFALWRN